MSVIYICHLSTARSCPARRGDGKAIKSYLLLPATLLPMSCITLSEDRHFP